MIVLIVALAISAVMVLGAGVLLAQRTRRLNAASKARARHRAVTPALGLSLSGLSRRMEQLS